MAMTFGDRRLRRVKLVAMLVVGLIAGLATGASTFPALGICVGWLAASLSYNVMIWSVIVRKDAEGTRAYAAAEDPGRGTTELLVVAASVVSLAAVAVVVLDSHNDSGGSVLMVGLIALACAMSSWLLVHTVFTLRYADTYYDGEEGGIDFNQDEPPTFLDIAYMAFSLGMTYQVSDTALTNSKIRRLALVHSLVSYLFGMFILAGTINILLGLAS